MYNPVKCMHPFSILTLNKTSKTNIICILAISWVKDLIQDTVECRQVSLPRNFQSFTTTADRRRGNLGNSAYLHGKPKICYVLCVQTLTAGWEWKQVKFSSVILWCIMCVHTDSGTSTLCPLEPLLESCIVKLVVFTLS